MLSSSWTWGNSCLPHASEPSRSLLDSGLFTAWLCCGLPLPLKCPHPAVAADVRPNPVDTLQLHLLPDVIPGLLVCSPCCALLTRLLALWFVLYGFYLAVHSSVDFPPAFVLDTLSSVHSVTVAYFNIALIIFLVLMFVWKMHSKHFLLYICIFYFFLSLFFYFVFWLCHMVYGILVPWRGIEQWPPYHYQSPDPLQWKYGVLTTGLPGKSPGFILLRGPFFLFSAEWICDFVMEL